MLNSDGDWSDTDGLPIELVIKMKYAYQLDAITAGIILKRIAPLLPAKQVEKFAGTMVGTAARIARSGSTERTEVSAEQILETARAIADFDDLCPPPPPWPWPWPWRNAKPEPEPWRIWGLAEVALVIPAAVDLITAIGSRQLQEALVPHLHDTLGALTETG